MTNWHDYSFKQMYQAVHTQDAYRQRGSAGGWRTLASQLSALSSNLMHYRDQVAPDWHSKGGEAFREKMTEVITTIDAYADEVRIYATILDETADAVLDAQEKMDDINARRAQYIGNREDWQEFGDPSNSDSGLEDVWNDVKDVGSDLWHNRPEMLGGDGFIDPAEMRKFDAEARTVMFDLSGKYETANAKRRNLPAYQGPFMANLLQIPGGGNAPGAPNIPASPAPPPAPNLPPGTTPPVPVPPVVPDPPVVPPGAGPELVGTPAPPVVTPPPTPVPPGAPGLPGTPVPPLIPGPNLPSQNKIGGGGGGVPRVTPPTVPNVPGKGGPTGPGVPPPPGRNAMKKSGVIGQRPGTVAGKPALPPSAGTGKGVIGKRPGDPSQRGGQPPAAGQQRRPGQQATPPPSQRGRGATPPRAGNGTGRNATPPPTGPRPGVIGHRPGTDEQGRHGTPPPAQRRDRRNTENQPARPKRIPGTIGPGNTAWGTPPPTIGNTSRPTGPTSMDHGTIGGRPHGEPVRRAQPGADGPEHHRPRGIAARDAAPPVLGRERPAQPQQVEPPPSRRSQHPPVPIGEDYGVSESDTATPVIQTPERHERDERGPAIGAG